MSAVWSGVGGGAVGGAVGDTYGQATEIGLGWRKKFSFKEVAFSGAVGGVAGGGLAAWGARGAGAAAETVPEDDAPQLAPLDTVAYDQHPESAPLGPGTLPGDYVYVRDLDGVVHVLPNYDHMHPLVLGGARSATGAGTLFVGEGGVVTSLDNISGTFQFGPSSLQYVAGSIERQGLTIAPDAVRPFDAFSRTP